jgi:hypothetical protein
MPARTSNDRRGVRSVARSGQRPHRDPPLTANRKAGREHNAPPRQSSSEPSNGQRKQTPFRPWRRWHARLPAPSRSERAERRHPVSIRRSGGTRPTLLAVTQASARRNCGSPEFSRLLIMADCQSRTGKPTTPYRGRHPVRNDHSARACPACKVSIGAHRPGCLYHAHDETGLRASKHAASCWGRTRTGRGVTNALNAMRSAFS